MTAQQLLGTALLLVGALAMLGLLHRQRKRRWLLLPVAVMLAGSLLL